MLNNGIINNIKYILLICLVAIIPISYHPAIFNVSNMEQGTVISKYIIILTIIVFIISFRFRIFVNSFIIKTYFIVFFSIALELLGLYALGFDISIGNELRELFIPFIALIIGYQLSISEKKLLSLIYVFIIMMTYVGLNQIFTNIGGFVIEDQYLTNAKNSLGALMSFVSLLSFLLFLKNENTYLRFISLMLLIISVIILLTIRARTATVISLVLLFAISIRYFVQLKKKPALILKIALSILFISILFLFSNQTFYDKIQQFLYNSFTAGSQSNDIFSGRLERNSTALNIVTSSPFWGNLTFNQPIEWVHNYLLLKLSSYGLLGGFLWIYLYTYLSIILIKSFLKNDTANTQNWGIYLMLISFGISMAEPTFPYGPGSVSFIPFLMFGIFLSKNKNK